MKKFEVIVYLNEELCMASQRNFTIECEYDLSLGDERACEIVEQECEKRGYLTNDEDHLGGGWPRELEGFDIIGEGQQYNSVDIVEVRHDDCI